MAKQKHSGEWTESIGYAVCEEAYDEAIRERDKARDAARTLFRLFRSQLDVASWLEHEPWLADDPTRERGAC